MDSFVNKKDVEPASLNLLQLRTKIKQFAERAGTLMSDDHWPLESPHFSRASYPDAHVYRGIAGLYFARYPSHGSNGFKAWWSAQIAHFPDKRKRGKASKKEEITQQRARLLTETRAAWRREEDALLRQMECDDGSPMPSVMVRAVHSAANVSDKKHKKELLKVVFAFSTALRVWESAQGLYLLNVLFEKAYLGVVGERSLIVDVEMIVCWPLQTTMTMTVVLL